MTTVLIVIHLMVVLAMIGLVLLQRSEGGALGIGGGSGNLLSGRGAGNVLTRSTGVLAAVFFATSIGLAVLSRMEAGPSDILDRLPGQTAPIGTEAPTPQAPIGAPESAQDVLDALGGAATGPQSPPAVEGQGGPQAPAANSAPQPAPAEAPAASAPAGDASGAPATGTAQ